MELPGNEHVCRECYAYEYERVTRGKKWGIRDDLRELRRCPLADLLVASNVLVFIAMAVSFGTVSPSAQQLKLWGADFGPLTLNGQWWRLFSAAFIHAYPSHLIFNMVGLLALGSVVERAYGKLVLFSVYVATIFAASSASVIWHPSITCVGASGGIFGLLGFLIPPIATGALSLRSRRLRNPAKVFAANAIYSLVMGALIPFIDNAAHVGGLISGLLIGVLFAMFGRSPLSLQLHSDGT